MFLFFFLFKQKTAYDMRISDWSSDVCSSDLTPPTPAQPESPTFAAHPTVGRAHAPDPRATKITVACRTGTHVIHQRKNPRARHSPNQRRTHRAPPTHQSTTIANPDRKSTRLNSRNKCATRMPSSA